MKISQIRTLDVGTQGFTVEAVVGRCFPPKEYNGPTGLFSKQGVELVELADGKETKIFVRLGDGFITNGEVGLPITVTNCKLDEYKDELKLETTSKSVVTVERSGEVAVAVAQPTTATKQIGKLNESVIPPRGYDELLDDVIEDAVKFFSNDKLKTVMDLAQEKGFKSEDVRSVIISRMIEKSRKW